MNRSTAFLASLAILPFVCLTACGSDDSDGSSASAKTATTAAETTAAAPAATTTATATTAAPATTTAPVTKAEAVATCHKDFDPFIANLRKLNKEVADGPHYERYSALMRKLIDRYGTLRSLDLFSASCNSEVQMQISSARLIHVGAYVGWQACHKSGDHAVCAKTVADLKKNRREAVRLTSAAVKGFRNVTAGS
jgi:hypothetical protein